MMRAQNTLRWIGLCLIAASVVLAAGYPLIMHQIVGMLERFVSPDGAISAEGVRQLDVAFYFLMIALLCAGIAAIKTFDPVWRVLMARIMFGDPLCQSRPPKLSPKYVLSVSVAVGVILIVSMYFTPRAQAVFTLLYAKDQGVLDLLAPASFIVSAGLLIIAFLKFAKSKVVVKQRLLVLLAYLCMTLLFVAYAGEEISWGQDFLHWQTPALFAGNVEEQTNLHNYFNDYFSYGYVALALILPVVAVSIWLEVKQYWLPYNRLLLPHPSLIGLATLIAFVAVVWYGEQELLEELVAVFVLFFSLRLSTAIE
jgi:hypothetical protein